MKAADSAGERGVGVVCRCVLREVCDDCCCVIQTAGRAGFWVLQGGWDSPAHWGRCSCDACSHPLINVPYVCLSWLGVVPQLTVHVGAPESTPTQTQPADAAAAGGTGVGQPSRPEAAAARQQQLAAQLEGVKQLFRWVRLHAAHTPVSHEGHRAKLFLTCSTYTQSLTSPHKMPC
jgi:hypothetical protein